jgi:hypothetical protein
MSDLNSSATSVNTVEGNTTKANELMLKAASVAIKNLDFEQAAREVAKGR